MSSDEQKKPEQTSQEAGQGAGASPASSAASSPKDRPDDKNKTADKGKAADKAREGSTGQRGQRGHRGLILLAVILFVFLAGLFAWPFIIPRLQAYLPDGMRLMPAQDVATTETTDALAKRIDALESTLASRPAPASEQAFNDLKQQVDRQAGQMADLAQRLDAAQNDSRFADLMKTHQELASSIRDLQVRLSKLENAAPTGQRATLLALAATRLRLRAATARPFPNDLALVQRLAKDVGGLDAAGTKALNDLGPHAAEGAPSERDLVMDFPMAARAAMKEAAVPADASWWRAALDRILALVTIRHTGPIKGDSVEAHLSRAQARLDADDLAGAVSEVEAIKGTPADKIDPWLQSAYARLAIDRAARALEGAAYRLGADLTSGGAAAGQPAKTPGASG